jgi:hypothetical protein
MQRGRVKRGNPASDPALPGWANLPVKAAPAGPILIRQEAIMSAHRPHREPRPRAVAGHVAARLRRLAAALAAVTCTLLASAAVMPAAWAVNVIPNDGPAQAPSGGVVIAGGMPGWQITLIALGAALVAATAAVRLDRARAARRAASAITTT